MSDQWQDQGTFHMGINMAGAVSAGAYTAGALDFLIEALEEWYALKAQPGIAVPMHNVSIDVFSGASAGGMCAAISAVMLQGMFEHIRSAGESVTGSTNRFYESWVNRVDIQPLLGTSDLKPGAPVISLLDSSIIDEIADYAIAPVPLVPRSYVSPSLTLFLTLTNLRGVPFSLNGDAAGSAEETVAYYADRLQFETVMPGSQPRSPFAKPLPIGQGGGSWQLLKQAAKATGAFPLFLAPREIDRTAGEYENCPWQSIASALPGQVKPAWPLNSGDAFRTLNVDGGVTDNDPFQLAHDWLAIHNPLATLNTQDGELHNPPDPKEANCAVLTVAPFPVRDAYDENFECARRSSILAVLPQLFTALISQSRFQGETLAAVMSGTSSSRFVLAPSDFDRPGSPALQCAALGAFGGFCERSFRAHDFELGRRNCQKFLRDHFRLSASNPIIGDGLRRVDPAMRQAVSDEFAQAGTFPIIPLCGTADAEAPAPTLGSISEQRLEQVVDWAVVRTEAIARPILESLIGSGFRNWAARTAVDTLISTIVRTKLKAALEAELKDVLVANAVGAH